MIDNGVRPTVITFNTLLSGLLRYGVVEHARPLFNEMKRVGFVPNSTTLLVYIDGLCKNGHLEDALDLLSSIDFSTKARC